MQRRIPLIIAFTLSFLLMFGSIARAEEIKVPISAPVSESNPLELIIKVPSTETNKADCSPLQEQASQLEVNGVGTRCKECLTTSGKPGQCVARGDIPCAYCKPCLRAMCDCTTPPPEYAPGNWIRVGTQWYCQKCGG